jgi:hypothetical protein
MSELPSSPSLRETVLGKIKRGEVTMRPKWQFMLKGILVVLGAVLLALALLYLVSFVFFALRQTGVWFAPSFGLRGLYALMVGIPWFLVFVAIVFVIVLEILVRRYAFAYRKPLLYSVLGITIAVFVGGFVVAKTEFHRSLYRHMEGPGLPVAGPLYREYGMPHMKQIHPGIIASTTEQGFIIMSRQGGEVTVLITPTTRLPLGYDFVLGDQVVIMGEQEEGVVRAFGVRKIDEEFREELNIRMMPPPGRMRPPWFPPQP